MSDVRLVTETDVDDVVATVASAFAQDPAWTFMLGAGNRPAMEAFARVLLMPRIGRKTAWLADNGAAVAMWDRRPEGADAHDPEAEERWARFRADAGEAVWQRMEVYEAAVDGASPAKPYWYLGVLATHPNAQGRGLATAVMQPGFDAAAHDGWHSWLETSTLANKAFYERRGFAEQTAVDIPGGPLTWWMRRTNDS